MPDFPNAFTAVAEPGAPAPETTMTSPQAGTGADIETGDAGLPLPTSANGPSLHVGDDDANSSEPTAGTRK